MYKKRLFTPGPTPVPEHVMLTMAEPLIHHRHPEFIALFERVNENLKYLFQTKQNVYTLTSSGTGAMETAVCNLLSPGDMALFVNTGKFGERWGEICSVYGVRAEEVKVVYGNAVDPDEIIKRLTSNPEIKVVFLTQSETSTAVANDIKTIAQKVRAVSDALIVVDGITSVGSLEMKMDEWGLDVVLTGSQKGLMIPPGLAFIAVSERAWNAIDNSKLPKFYFSLKKAKQAITAEGTPWTPAISLFIGLDAALQMIRNEGIENVWQRHQRIADAVREGCKAIGLTLFAKSPSNALTAVNFPPGIDEKQFTKIVKGKYGFTLAGGQSEMKGKIFRISHLGYYDDFDALAIISGLELTFAECGLKFEPGAGVKAAQAVLAKK